MKKIFLIIFFFVFIFSISIKAENPTASVTPTIEEKEITELKEKIASKVAQLQKENPKGVSGYIENIEKNLITVTDIFNNKYQIKTDDLLTKYYQIENNTQKEINRDQLKKDQFIIVKGIINGDQVEANAIFIDESFFVNSGEIIEVNKEEYFIKIQLLDKKIITLDIESYTKQNSINLKTLEIEKIGFSKLKEGDIVHFVAKINNRQKLERFSAIKILLIPQEYFLKQ